MKNIDNTNLATVINGAFHIACRKLQNEVEYLFECNDETEPRDNYLAAKAEVARIEALAKERGVRLVGEAA